MSQTIVYIPPEPNAIRQFVRTVAQQLAEQQKDERYLDPDNVAGLASYMNVLAQVMAKYLSTGRDHE